MNVVLDTNVLISGLKTRGGTCAQVLEVASQAQAVVVTGNHKHYPTRVCGKVRVLSPAELIESLRK